ALAPEQISSIEVVRGKDAPSKVHVTTVEGEKTRLDRSAKEPFVAGVVERKRVPMVRADSTAGTFVIERRPDATASDRAPLMIVDGVIMSGELKEIDAKSIEKVEVVKGKAAQVLYGDRASAGVILITTKKP